MERRKEPRVVYGAWVHVVTADADTPFFFRAVNLSPGGILLRAPTSGWSAADATPRRAEAAMPQVGHLVSIRLVIENEQRVISVSGEVVHHVGDRFGVRFVDLDGASRDFIAALLDELPDTEDERAAPATAYQHTKPH